MILAAQVGAKEIVMVCDAEEINGESKRYYKLIQSIFGNKIEQKIEGKWEAWYSPSHGKRFEEKTSIGTWKAIDERIVVHDLCCLPSTAQHYFKINGCLIDALSCVEV